MTLPDEVVLAFAKAVVDDFDVLGLVVDIFCFLIVPLVGLGFAKVVISEFARVGLGFNAPTLDAGLDAVFVGVRDCDRVVTAFLWFVALLGSDVLGVVVLLAIEELLMLPPDPDID